MRITRRCKIKLSISVDYANEVEFEVELLDVCEMMFGNTYLWDRDVTFNKY
jgi:hypothetical protein